MTEDRILSSGAGLFSWLDLPVEQRAARIAEAARLRERDEHLAALLDNADMSKRN